MNQTETSMMPRERMKRTIFAIVCLVFAVSLAVVPLRWPASPPVTFAFLVPSVAYFLVAVQMLLKRSKEGSPVRDQVFVANVVWSASIFFFLAMILGSLNLLGSPLHAVEAIMSIGVALGVLVLAAAYKVISAVNEAELRLRERVLAVGLDSRQPDRI